MLSPRDNAQSQYREVVSMGRANVLGGDMTTINAGRLERARRAERTIRAALHCERTGLLEPNDAVLDDMLSRVRSLVQTLEIDAARHDTRRGS